MTTLTFTLAQINPTVGDVKGNAQKIHDIWQAATSDLVIFPELVLSGYPPEDLVLKPAFLDAIETAIETLCQQSRNFTAAALIGTPWIINGNLSNVVLLIENGKITHTQAKHHLPNYNVFDEMRTFESGPLPSPVKFRNTLIGLMICEDTWYADVAHSLASQGAEILIVPNASPFDTSKFEIRQAIALERCTQTNLPMLYVNLIGGQDELVFDGGSFVMDTNGKITHQADFFKETTTDVSFDTEARSWKLEARSKPSNLQHPSSNIYNALALGLHDYLQKNGFKGVLLGLSGGIDSALAAVIASQAIGAQNVHCVMMPSPFTSQDSLDDAKALAENLGCPYEIIPIQAAMSAFEQTLPNLQGTAHENMQSRTRGLILMSKSNTTGHMVLTTGNKSEMAVGYATLYGDMCGGFNALKDLYKTQVYALSEWINRDTEIIPNRIITKAPTAELKPNQTDQDSLPDYKTLDDILECLIEFDMSVDEITKRGHDTATVQRITNLLNIAEYKRRQSPPGTKITTIAFGRDRRYPITNGFKG